MGERSLTGRLRIQHRSRMFLPPQLVVQVEHRVWHDHNGPAGVECEQRTIWEDATIDDLGVLNQPLLWAASQS